MLKHMARADFDNRSLDPIDREILSALAEDARIPFRALGARVGLSANGAADRVRRLQERGVLAGFTTRLSRGALGETIEALVDVRLTADLDDESFEAAVAALPAVVEDLHLTGAVDHQLRVSCGTPAELNGLLRTLRRQPGVARIETRLILSELLHRRPEPAD